LVLDTGEVSYHLGCGDAKIAQSFQDRFKVHSFDLVAINPFVRVADISHIPMQDQCADVVVFCLSLMGTNFLDFLVEAHRLLKVGGVLYIAEVKSRFEQIHKFVKVVTGMGFTVTHQNLENTMFVLFMFKKIESKKPVKINPNAISLKPCLYKKR